MLKCAGGAEGNRRTICERGLSTVFQPLYANPKMQPTLVWPAVGLACLVWDGRFDGRGH